MKAPVRVCPRCKAEMPLDAKVCPVCNRATTPPGTIVLAVLLGVIGCPAGLFGGCLLMLSQGMNGNLQTVLLGIGLLAIPLVLIGLLIKVRR
ncbi:MAG: hypothetical protein JSS66_16510 [Armatimonadetes bacterium]|nr:hypothetical protein [Armatimonadota bacterium]